MNDDVAAEEHRGRVADRPHPELDRGGGDLDRGRVAVAGVLALGDPARGLRLRPLLVDGLVAGPQVLVDQRRPELARVDRPGDGLDRRHRGQSMSRLSLTTAITIEAIRQATSTIIR